MSKLVQVQLSDAVHARLRAYAERQHLSIRDAGAEIIERAVDEADAETPKPKGKGKAGAS